MKEIASTALTPVSHETVVDLAYSALRSALLRREFQAEQQLDLHVIGASLMVSQTPIKAALRRLHDEGLVEVRPRQGTYVAAITEVKLRTAAEARSIVETWAVGEVASRHDQSELSLLDQLIGESELLFGRDLTDVVDLEDKFASLDRQFHAAIVEFGGNHLVSKFYESLNSHVLLARAWCLEEKSVLEGRVRAGIAEHREILRAIATGESILAAELVRRHIDASVEGACAVIQSAGGRI